MSHLLINRYLNELQALWKVSGPTRESVVREALNPSLNEADVREMLIQHILTEEIFSKVFGEDDFHRQNNVAKALYDLEPTFFTGNVKKKTLKGLGPYYATIRAAADRISNHHEKQAFLKISLKYPLQAKWAFREFIATRDGGNP